MIHRVAIWLNKTIVSSITAWLDRGSQFPLFQIEKMYACGSLQHFEDMLIVKFPFNFLWKFSVMISISLFNLQLYPDNVGIRGKMLQLFLCLHVSLIAIWWVTCIYIFILILIFVSCFKIIYKLLSVAKQSCTVSV